MRSKLRKPRYIALAVAVLAFIHASVIAAEPTKYFSIEMDEKLIGYGMVHRDSFDQDGRTVLRLKSQTSLKYALLGQERHTMLESETLIDPQTGQPLRYKMTDTTNESVQHVESEFADGMARTWGYRDGETRGDAIETKLPDGVVILGNNNFGHWQLLINTAMAHIGDDTFKLAVFLPAATQVDSFEFDREQPRDVSVGGQLRKCQVWNLTNVNMNAFADAESGEFVRLDVPAQKTTIELANANVVKLAQRAQAEEVLARHFINSNVLFDDFLKVNQLKADVDVKVIGSGIENEPSVLNTSMQIFEGEKNGDHIVGEIRVHTVTFDGNSDSLAFPKVSPNRDRDVWLSPSVYIESDHPAIVAKAQELTKGSKTRWDAVLKIGQWVHREITYVIADTPSAKLALETRKGDCGPHATLMVAMLRAVDIPSRLVGGLVYTPVFGGSFGQHAWVEVHMGDSGWIAMDPTTGEFDQLSATHMKLFEGLGGVIPESVKVTEFEPPNRVATTNVLAEAKPLPWKIGQEYKFKYSRGGKEFGTESFTINQIEKDEADAYELKAEVQLKINLIASLKTNTTLVVAPTAQPISFMQDLSALLQKVKIACSFEDGVVKEEIRGTTNLSREIKLPTGAYCFDNNFMGSWALICSQLDLVADEPVQIQTFHPSTLQVIALTFTAKFPAAIEIGGKQVDCFECEVSPIKNTFWVSRDGRFLRAKQGDVVIELVEED